MNLPLSPLGSFPESKRFQGTIELVSTVVEETPEDKFCSVKKVAETVVTGFDAVQACADPVHQKLESLDVSDSASQVAFESVLDSPLRSFRDHCTRG